MMVCLRRGDGRVDVVVLVNKDAKRLALSEGSSSKLRLSGFLGSVLKASLTRICVWTKDFYLKSTQPSRPSSIQNHH